MLKSRFTEDTKSEAGVDEAGRGCLWGPMYAAAVVWPLEKDWTDTHREIAPQIKDSKKLTAKKRHLLAIAIKELAVSYAVGVVTPREMDESGMTFANRLAFTRAIQGLSVKVNRLLIDGSMPLIDEQLKECNVETQELIVDGDALYLAIAAASIVAKEGRDSWIQEQVALHPALQSDYSIGSSKGYGTAKHREAILKLGKLPDHRALFLRKLLGSSYCRIHD